MKSKNQTQNYHEMAKHLNDLVAAMEVIISHYNEANCTFAEALGEQGLSHELDQGGRFHYLPGLFNKNRKCFAWMMEQLRAAQSEYEVLKLLETTHFN